MANDTSQYGGAQSRNNAAPEMQSAIASRAETRFRVFQRSESCVYCICNSGRVKCSKANKKVFNDCIKRRLCGSVRPLKTGETVLKAFKAVQSV